MENIGHEALDALKSAYENGKQHVIFTHGASTSGPGKTTSRSQVLKLMRSPVATPYIIRGDCVQHATVFIAAIRQR